MKICGKCKKSKELKEFYYYKGEPRHWCKNCDKINTIIRQRIFKEKCIKYKGGKCEKCGYSKYIGALEFHHKDPSEKEFGIAKAKLRKFDQKVKDELDKCKLLCSNCHREEHQKYESKEINGLWDWYQERRIKEKLIQKEELSKLKTCKCGKEKSKTAELCFSCKYKDSVNRSIEEVLDKLKSNNYNWTQTAVYFNLSDNGLRKFVKSKGYDPKEFRRES